MRADHAERLQSCPEFAPGEPQARNVCQTDGHYLCQECRHIALAKTTAELEKEAQRLAEEQRAGEAALRLSGDYPNRCVHCQGVIVGAPPRCTRCGSYRGDR